MAELKYKRILVKLGGEALSGHSGSGIDAKAISTIADQIHRVKLHGTEIALVIGGGNFWRGNDPYAQHIERSTADYMGMLATVINALALQEALERRGILTRVQSAIEMRAVAEPYIRRRAIRHLEKGRVVIFAAGTGNPYFTTDTAAALRAAEIEAEILIKATKVDGVYERDPLKHVDAKRLSHLTYMEALNRSIEILDSTALTLCRDNNLPILVVGWTGNNLERAVMGEPIGTLIDQQGREKT